MNEAVRPGPRSPLARPPRVLRDAPLEPTATGRALRGRGPLGLAPVALAALGLLPSGCAAVFKAEPLVPRLYEPRASEAPAPAPPRTPGLSLRLRTVEGADHLREQQAYRVGPNELRLYEVVLWTEKPAEYLRRALAQELFERRGLRRVRGARAATLEAELVAFEEVRSPEPGVRLEAVFVLWSDEEALWEATLRVERGLPEGEDRHARVAEALGAALREVAAQAAEAVQAALRRRGS
ncbi:MAG: hypothetical protein D6731_02205 [Planctomycetota bacterium]|nr:MAG: hypothetical protein D6731_02205 [Planctomycetota bacterium]